MPHYVCSCSICLTINGKKTFFDVGEQVDPETLPAGTVASMLRLGQLQLPEDYEPPSVVESSPTGAPDDDGAPAWQSQSVTALGLTPGAIRALISHDLKTVGDILAYGEEHGSLTAIDKIGDEKEKAIQQAIEALAQQ